MVIGQTSFLFHWGILKKKKYQAPIIRREWSNIFFQYFQVYFAIHEQAKSSCENQRRQTMDKTAKGYLDVGIIFSKIPNKQMVLEVPW